MMGGHIFPDINRPFASCPKPLFHNEAKCEAIDMKVFFYSHANKTFFHKRLFQNSHFKSESFGTRKWPIADIT